MMEEALVAALVTAVDRGHRADSGYKKEAWEYAKTEVQRVAGPAKLVTASHCKNKHDNLKKDWKVWVELTNQSGFGIGDNGVVTGPPEALEAYFEAHKDARKFKYRPIKFAESLRQLFDGVLATGQEVMTVDDLINARADDAADSIERDLSVTPRASSWSREYSEPIVTPRKRSASSSVTGSVRSAKRSTATDRLGRELGGLTDQLEALVAAMEKDYQRDAIKVFLHHYHVLHEALKLAIVEAFEKEYAAKAFCVMKPNMRRKWVRQQLLRRREIIVSTELEADEFDAAIKSVQWDGDSDLVLREVVDIES
jgi:hypothetical protein